MSEELDRYLTDSYRQDILGESVEVGVPAPDPELIADVKARIARIDALRLGPNLASRDFVSYQHRQALVRLLAELQAEQARRKEAEDAS